MTKKSKSVLDGVEVKDQGYPLYDPPKQPRAKLMSVVSQCPRCGGPIYGHAVTDEDTPPIRYTCDCKQKRQAFEDTIQRK